MGAYQDQGTKYDNEQVLPDNLVWALIVMGMMFLITFVSL
jgi:hypothetical protein